MDLPEVLVTFRKSPYFRVLYLLVLSLMVYALLIVDTCVMVFLVPITMFVFPYWLKERRLRNFALDGLIVVLVAGLLFSGVLANSLASSPPVPVGGSAPGVALTNGTVTPGQGAPGSTFNFTAVLTVPAGGSPAWYRVWVNLSQIMGLDVAYLPAVEMAAVNSSDLDLTDGKLYYAPVTVEDRVHYYWFSVNVLSPAPGSWFQTEGQFGPLVSGFGSYFSFAFAYGMLTLLLPASFYYMLLLLYWYTQRAKVERQRLGLGVPASGGGDGGFMCTNCGADVPEAADRCPKCGAVFEEEEAAGPSPGAPEEGSASEEPPEPPKEGPGTSGEGPDGKS